MNAREFLDLQDAYQGVYQEFDEATAMAKRGLDEPEIRQQIAKSTGGGAAADRATALADKKTFGQRGVDPKARQDLARKQRGDHRTTASSNPGLKGYAYKATTPEDKAKQSARGAQRGSAALTPNERKQLNMEMEYDTSDAILEYLIAEGYADTNENALAIMENMSEDWREDIMEKEDSEYEKASDAALDSRYGYGRASGDKRSFGRAANRSSAAAALRAIRRGESSGSGTSREAGSDAVHRGWAKTAKTSTDQTPEKKERRAKLANTSYSNLPDDEKEKDRVSFDAVRATYNRNKKP